METPLVSLSAKVGRSVGRRGFLKLGLAGAAAIAAPLVAPNLAHAASMLAPAAAGAGDGGNGGLVNPIPRATMQQINPMAGFAVVGGGSDPGSTAEAAAFTSNAAIRGCECTYLGQCTDGCGHGCPFGSGNVFFCDYYYCQGTGCSESGYVCSSCYCAKCN